MARYRFEIDTSIVEAGLKKVEQAFLKAPEASEHLVNRLTRLKNVKDL